MKMKRSQLGAQIYSFREFIKTKAGAAETFQRLADMGYRGLQLSGSIAPMPEEELLELLDKAGLAPLTSHESAERILNDTAAVIARLKKLNCPHAAYPFIHQIPTGTNEVIEIARDLNRAAEEFRQAGLILGYHNHSIELFKIRGTTILETIYANAPALEAQFDTYWLWKGGNDPVKWLNRFRNRISVLHLKDYGMLKPDCATSGMFPIGSGNLDWDAILEAAAGAGVKSYIVEQDMDVSGEGVFESFAKSAKYLERFIEE